ncbi:unnamed protein product, partial [Mesorhabditis belari]|uniref:PDZ domain-containing protein n=1 Tax=Mesorhabditis belari TaxID=2138241 RepID=A0AAF3F6A0_9BILA
MYDCPGVFIPDPEAETTWNYWYAQSQENKYFSMAQSPSLMIFIGVMTFWDKGRFKMKFIQEDASFFYKSISARITRNDSYIGNSNFCSILTNGETEDTKIKNDVTRETKEEVSGAVKKSKNPLSAVPERLLNKRTLNFKVPPAKVFDVKVNSACQVITLPTFGIKTEQLDLGDLIKDVNGTEITAKSQLNSFLKKLATDSKAEYEVNITFLRVIRTEPIPLNSPLIPAAVDLQLGFTYLEGHMLLLPRGSLGLKIKTYNNKVYVTSTDNGFNCVSKRTLLVGDAILSVDQKPVSMLKECSEMLTSCLEREKDLYR